MRLRPLLTGVAVAAALVAVLFLGSIDSAKAATTFNPTLQVSLETPTAGASSDITSKLDIPQGDVNFAAFIAFIPQKWGVVTGDNVDVGAPVGSLDANSVLGLANGACNTALPVHFDMQNGSLNMNNTVSYNDEDDNNTADYADTDAAGYFKSVSSYPDWLKRIFTDTGNPDGNPLQPIRRSTGITPVAGIPVILQFLVFPPGTQIDPAIPHDASLGYPSVTVLQNIGDESAVPAPSIINDFCTPLSTINISGGTVKAPTGETPGPAEGAKLLVNPGDGTYKFNTFALGQRDADSDSYENSLDTCALTPNVGNPRITGDGDVDSDGLDASCDPNDSISGGTNSDQDGDGYQNRQDNCPLVANGQEQDNQKDSDLDQIGDACDPAPTTPNGDYTVAQPTVDVAVGAGGSGEGAAATCQGCWTAQTKINTGGPTPAPSVTAGNSASGSTTPKPSGSGGATISPSPSPKDSGSNSGTIIAIVVGVAAAVIVVGGGAALLMRKKSP
ncbi:MAG: thrombospondin type 3 repeat-containing protein [Chloroflexota bacterium]